MYVSIPKSLDIIIEKTLLDGNPIFTKAAFYAPNGKELCLEQMLI